MRGGGHDGRVHDPAFVLYAQLPAGLRLRRCDCVYVCGDAIMAVVDYSHPNVRVHTTIQATRTATCATRTPRASRSFPRAPATRRARRRRRRSRRSRRRMRCSRIWTRGGTIRAGSDEEKCVFVCVLCIGVPDHTGTCVDGVVCGSRAVFKYHACVLRLYQKKCHTVKPAWTGGRRTYVCMVGDPTRNQPKGNKTTHFWIDT